MTRERAAHEARMARLAVQARKADAHRKIVLGGALLAFLRLSPDKAAPILAALDPLIVRRCDRVALGLPLSSVSPADGSVFDFLTNEEGSAWMA